jgi:nuclear transport factor 2 (NTF2) superfamily protein
VGKGEEAIRQADMTKTELEQWLKAYGRAWESRDPDAVAILFAEDARYHETPFTEPASGRDGVRAYWAAATASHREVEFGFEILAVVGSRGIARWSASFSRSEGGARHRLDGVFVLDFNSDRLCEELREWWHIRRPQRVDGGDEDA